MYSNASGSRKNSVTLIRSDFTSAVDSSGWASRYFA
jgi:hypothetical protein